MNAQNKKPRQERDFSVDAPAELLKFLLENLTGMSRNSVKSLLTRGDVFVDGKSVTRHDTPLKPGMTVRIAAPGDRLHNDIKKRLKVIYEDEELIAMDKPAGILSVATENERNETAYHLLTDYVRLEGPQNRVFVVHRLDRDTSGVLLAAKNEKMKRVLQDQWNALVRTRGYTAVAEGVFAEKSGTVRSWLKETKTHLVYSSDRSGDGQEAVTNYRITKESGTYSMVDITIDTGRKNQIRVHLHDLGHPVAGDKKYGAKTNPLKRLCLHAGLLEVLHPDSGRLLVFESAVPKGFPRLF